MAHMRLQARLGKKHIGLNNLNRACTFVARYVYQGYTRIERMLVVLP